MERLSKETYNNKEMVSSYEDRYINHPFVKDESAFELNLIESLTRKNKTSSWCDVACGTGYHLRNARGNYKRFGIDASSLMVESYKRKTKYKVEYHIEDLLSFKVNETYDLVTNFWFGYSHQETLDQVIKFFEKMTELTAKQGSIILSFHDQWSLFKKIPKDTPEPLGGIFSFNAIEWSYSEPNNPECVYKCISPHTDLIVKTFAPYFYKHRIIDYPKHKGRRILLLEGKL